MQEWHYGMQLLSGYLFPESMIFIVSLFLSLSDLFSHLDMRHARMTSSFPGRPRMGALCQGDQVADCLTLFRLIKILDQFRHLPSSSVTAGVSPLTLYIISALFDLVAPFTPQHPLSPPPLPRAQSAPLRNVYPH